MNFIWFLACSAICWENKVLLKYIKFLYLWIFFLENNIFNCLTPPLPTVPRIAAVVMSSPTKLAHCGGEGVLSWLCSLVPQPTCSWNPVTSQLGNPTMILLLSGCTTTRWNRQSTMIGIFWKLPPCTLCHQSVLNNYSTCWKINISKLTNHHDEFKYCIDSSW